MKNLIFIVSVNIVFLTNIPLLALSRSYSISLDKTAIEGKLSNSNTLEKMSCQQTVDRIIQKIKNKGVKRIEYNIDRNIVNQIYRGNPSNRNDQLVFLFGKIKKHQERYSDYHQIINILSSKQLLNAWSNRVVSSCGNTAIVAFVQANTDGGTSFFIQSDGKTKESTCIYPGNFGELPKFLPWGVEICL
jgi:copper chaperone CopZ